MRMIFGDAAIVHFLRKHLRALLVVCSGDESYVINVIQAIIYRRVVIAVG